MNDFGPLTAGDPDYITRAILLASVIVFFVWIAEQSNKGGK